MSDQPLVVIGAGAIGHQTLRVARSIPSFFHHESVLIADDHVCTDEWQELAVHERVAFARWPELIGRGDVIVGLGYQHLELRHKIVDEVRASGGNALSPVHPSVIVADSVLVDRTNDRAPIGVLLFPGVLIDFDVSIADGVVINVGSVVAHDSTIGESCFFGASVSILGYVTVEPECFIGSGSVIRNGVTVGRGATIGMGSIVTRDVAAGDFVAGNPAHSVRPFKL